MTDAYSKLKYGTVILRWKDSGYHGFQDVLPFEFFSAASPKRARSHVMRAPNQKEAEVTCDITVNGTNVVLDYRPYKYHNLKNGALIGEVRLTFKTVTRHLIESVEWKGEGDTEFKKAKFDLIFLLSDVREEMIGGHLDAGRKQKIAEFLEVVREICPSCAVTKRVGKGWIFVPPSLFQFEPAQNKNLVTFWAGIAHHSIDIRRPRKGRGSDKSSEGKRDYEPHLLPQYRQRMIALMAERAPGDFAGATPNSDGSPGRKIFSGTLESPGDDVVFTPTDEAERKDMEAASKKRAASGARAEQIAFEYERSRLSDVGRPDLAAKVEIVSDRPALGYDIRSFEMSGKLRYIEVKNITKGNRFFISLNEWLNSQTRPNYWLYLVNEDETLPVTEMDAKTLRKEHLKPNEFIVTFKS